MKEKRKIREKGEITERMETENEGKEEEQRIFRGLCNT